MLENKTIITKIKFKKNVVILNEYNSHVINKRPIIIINIKSKIK